MICVDEDDIATYTIKSVDDPRALNKSLYIRPPQNILSQNEVIQLWEKHIGKKLKKSSLSKDEFLAMKKGTQLKSTAKWNCISMLSRESVSNTRHLNMVMDTRIFILV